MSTIMFNEVDDVSWFQFISRIYIFIICRRDFKVAKITAAAAAVLVYILHVELYESHERIINTKTEHLNKSSFKSAISVNFSSEVVILA